MYVFCIELDTIMSLYSINKLAYITEKEVTACYELNLMPTAG